MKTKTLLDSCANEWGHRWWSNRFDSECFLMLVFFLIVSGIVASCGGSSSSTSADNTSSVSQPGVVSSTANPLVAQYSIPAPAGSEVKIEFGPDTSYKFHTSEYSAPDGGGEVGILVAGMKSSTPYHMQAVITGPGVHRAVDADHVFTTGAPNPQLVPSLQVTGSSSRPNPGIEMLVLVNNSFSVPDQFQAAAADLEGNLIWYYNDPLLQPPNIPNPIKILQDGSVLINYSSSAESGLNSILRDIDLAGDVNWQIAGSDLAQSLAANGCFTGASVIGSHHDFVELPNGHLVVLVSLQENFVDLPGFPGTTAVRGDGLVDLDVNHAPVWCWSEFDHLDVNRQPMGFPDWTHSNAVLYSPKDGNLIVSLRHQNWILKINYANGAGDGSIIWHLGYQGDFTLKGGTDPIDWFYAQHGPSIIKDDGAGHLELAVFDNGNDRRVDAGGDLCGTTVACLSRATVWDLDENAMTATLSFQYDLPYLSDFGGNVEQLADSHLEFDAAASSTSGATIAEITKSSKPQLVWQLGVINQFAYRGFRIPSLYPGIQW